MDDKIDFFNDINKLSKNIDIPNDIKLNVKSFTDITTTNLILKWRQCFQFLGKEHLFITKKIQKIIYCLLSDCTIINSVNGQDTNLTFYDTTHKSYYGFDVINNDNRIVKIKLFNVCNQMVIIDCKQYPTYKIYHLYNLDIIKEYYGTSKINFDNVIQSICVMPIFIGNINNLVTDYKTLSLDKFKISYKRNVIFVLSYLEKTRAIENEIIKVQNELRDIYKAQMMR